jgi:hypothetical protein
LEARVIFTQRLAEKLKASSNDSVKLEEVMLISYHSWIAMDPAVKR